MHLEVDVHLRRPMRRDVTVPGAAGGRASALRDAPGRVERAP